MDNRKTCLWCRNLTPREAWLPIHASLCPEHKRLRNRMSRSWPARGRGRMTDPAAAPWLARLDRARHRIPFWWWLTYARSRQRGTGRDRLSACFGVRRPARSGIVTGDPVAANTATREASEFGRGIVVCLAKFSEHLWNGQYDRLRHMVWWMEASESTRQQQREEAAFYPVGDAARRLMDVRRSDDPAAEISHQIELWMNGASDHFYDLAPNAPEPLKELADLALRIGHGFTDETWTMEHVERIRELWQASCLAVDAMLGVESEWGQW